MSQIQALTAVVVVDKEPQRPLQGVERAAKAATAPRQAFEIGAQIGVETLNRVGLFFAHRDDMLASLRPDQFGIGGMAVAGVALGGGQGVYQQLQAGDVARGTGLGADNQPRDPRDGRDDVDLVFLCATKV